MMQQFNCRQQKSACKEFLPKNIGTLPQQSYGQIFIGIDQIGFPRTSCWASACLVTVCTNVWRSAPARFISEIREQIGRRQDLERLFIDVDAALDPERASQLIELSDSVIWCLHAGDER